MTRWFRSHASKLNKPKVLRLSDKLYRTWDLLLCVACEFDGVLPPLADTALLLRKNERETRALLDQLIEREFFVRTERGIEPHKWNEWQYKSDVSTSRVKRFRQRQRGVSETPSESETDTETEVKAAASSVPRDLAEVDRAFALWSALASELRIPDTGFLNTDRRTALHARLHESGGIEHWPDVLDRVRNAAFFRESDGTPKRWLNLGWLLKPENFTGLMEGRYAERHRNDKQQSGLGAALAGLAGEDVRVPPS